MASHASLVTVSGEIGLRELQAIRAQLLEALIDPETDVVVDVAEVTAAHLGFVQLLESARKSAVESGKSFRLAAPATGALESVLRRAGFAGEPAGAFWELKPGEA